MRSRMWASAGVALVVLVAGTQLWAQRYIPIETEGAYNVRIVNELGATVRVKFIGERAESNFSYELPAGDSVTRDFYAGDRMLGAWNSNNQLVFMAAVRVDRSGRIRLRNNYLRPYAAREGDRGEAAKSGALEIEKE